jgi:hypothetical protein
MISVRSAALLVFEGYKKVIDKKKGLRITPTPS